MKLTTLPSDEIRDLVGVGQEAFLVQLLEVGFFHGDPHPGNLLKVRTKGVREKGWAYCFLSASSPRQGGGEREGGGTHTQATLLKVRKEGVLSGTAEVCKR